MTMVSGGWSTFISSFPIRISKSANSSPWAWVSWALMLVWSSRSWIWGQMGDDLMEAWTMSARVPRWMTGRIWRKSPDRSVGIPPGCHEGCGRVLQNGAIASSMMMALASLSMRAKAVPLLMLLVGRVSERAVFSGTLNIEWTVSHLPAVSQRYHLQQLQWQFLHAF